MTQGSVSEVTRQHPELKSDRHCCQSEGVSPLSTRLGVRLLGRGGEVPASQHDVLTWRQKATSVPTVVHERTFLTAPVALARSQRTAPGVVPNCCRLIARSEANALAIGGFPPRDGGWSIRACCCWRFSSPSSPRACVVSACDGQSVRCAFVVVALPPDLTSLQVIVV